ncbi:hypothetical protein RSA11_15880 [Exiguobacterium indicum]|uniref:DUF1998 domain-containing protein n=3 Tax=Exiguobacterium TaxID=33986 RepID=A0AAW3M6Y1_9BACL|nr:hypothetical protein RSA11_15880 [Exiguobacterium indicum]
MFKYLPGAVFLHDSRYFKVNNLNLSKVSFDTSRIEDELINFITKWPLNLKIAEEKSISLFPKDVKKYYFGEIQEVEYELFPLVFRCRLCDNVHEYYSIESLKNDNPTLNCVFCNSKSSLKQFPYLMIHENGDLKGLKVINNGGNSFKEKYNGITMNDTRSFRTATWYNKKKNLNLGSLGANITTLPITSDMKRFMSGKHASDGDVFKPAIINIVNLNNEELKVRKQNSDFSFIQLAALLELDKVNKIDFNENFELQESNSFAMKLLEAAHNEAEKKLLQKVIAENMNQPYLLEDKSLKVDIENFLDSIKVKLDDELVDLVNNDRLLHEYLFSIYESEGKTVEDKIKESIESEDYLQTEILEDVKSKFMILGIEKATLLEKFPVLTVSPGFTRKSPNRNEVILNPYKQKIQGSVQTVIPTLLSENEAIIFKISPERILKWLKINQFIEDDEKSHNKKESELLLYFKTKIGMYDPAELAEMNLKLGEKMDEKMLSSVIFQLIHTLSHMMLNAGKSIIGLDVDSISEYIFPSSFSYAIYVSKIQGGGMGNLIAAFENDLNRWINASFEHAQLCLYDPVCKDHKAACHACSYLKFSCQHFNRGLSRTLLIGGIIEGKQIIGFLDSKVNN